MITSWAKRMVRREIQLLGLTSHHARFAERIAGRYRHRVPGRQAMLSMTLARRWMLQTLVQRRWTFQTLVQRHWQRSTFVIAPHIELRRASVDRTVVPGRAWREAPLTVSYRRGVKAVHLLTETLIQRVEARGRRVELTAGRGRPALPIERSVARIVRRTAPLLPQAENTAPAERSRSAASPKGTRRDPHLTPTAAHTIDVNRLTEQVIQGIDRRIIAQRERLGRF